MNDCSLTFQDHLEEMGACTEARDWVGGKNLVEAWAQCEQAQWMLWLAWRAGVSTLLIHAAAQACIDAVPVPDNVFAAEGLGYAREHAAWSLTQGSHGYLAVYAALRSCWGLAAYPEDGYFPSDDNGAYSRDRAALDRRFCDIVRQHITVETLCAPRLSGLRAMEALLR